MLWDVVQQTAVKILKNSSEGRVDDLLGMRATLRIPFRGILKCYELMFTFCMKKMNLHNTRVRRTE